eukprot:767568-Pleurochrysis_carterae.AAC.4
MVVTCAKGATGLSSPLPPPSPALRPPSTSQRSARPCTSALAAPSCPAEKSPMSSGGGSAGDLTSSAHGRCTMWKPSGKCTLPVCASSCLCCGSSATSRSVAPRLNVQMATLRVRPIAAASACTAHVLPWRASLGSRKTGGRSEWYGLRRSSGLKPSSARPSGARPAPSCFSS